MGFPSTPTAPEVVLREQRGRLKLEAAGRQQLMRQAAAVAAARGRAMEGGRCGSPQVFRDGRQAEICGFKVRSVEQIRFGFTRAYWPEVQAQADALVPQILQELTDESPPEAPPDHLICKLLGQAEAAQQPRVVWCTTGSVDLPLRRPPRALPPSPLASSASYATTDAASAPPPIVPCTAAAPSLHTAGQLAHAAANASWPPKLALWVKRSFAQCSGQVERDQVEKSVKGRVAAATSSGQLLTTNWNTEPLAAKHSVTHAGRTSSFCAAQLAQKLAKIDGDREDGSCALRPSVLGRAWFQSGACETWSLPTTTPAAWQASVRGSMCETRSLLT